MINQKPNKLAPHHAQYLIEVYKSVPHPKHVDVEKNAKLMESCFVLGLPMGRKRGILYATIRRAISNQFDSSHISRFAL